MAITFVTYVSGSMTGQIIRQPVDTKMAKVEELIERNYSLLYPPGRVRMLQRLINSVLLSGGKANKESRTALPYSMERFEVLFNKSIQANFSTYLAKMATAKRLATVSSWTLAISISDINEVKIYIHQEEIMRKSYIWMEPAYLAQLYYVISPVSCTGAAKMIKTFQALKEAGNGDLWKGESEGIYVAKSVTE